MPEGLDIEKGSSDSWFAGYTTNYTAAVWTGYDKTNAEQYLTPEDQKIAKYIFKSIVSEVSKDKKTAGFEKPKSVEEIYINKDTGYITKDKNGSNTVRELIVKGTSVKELLAPIKEKKVPKKKEPKKNEDKDKDKEKEKKKEEESKQKEEKEKRKEDDDENSDPPPPTEPKGDDEADPPPPQDDEPDDPGTDPEPEDPPTEPEDPEEPEPEPDTPPTDPPAEGDGTTGTAETNATTDTQPETN